MYLTPTVLPAHFPAKNTAIIAVSAGTDCAIWPSMCFILTVCHTNLPAKIQQSLQSLQGLTVQSGLWCASSLWSFLPQHNNHCNLHQGLTCKFGFWCASFLWSTLLISLQKYNNHCNLQSFLHQGLTVQSGLRCASSLWSAMPISQLQHNNHCNLCRDWLYNMIFMRFIPTVLPADLLQKSLQSVPGTGGR